MERRRFRFLKKLSEGTFGKVYLAEVITDNNFSKVVAIKLLHAKWVDHDEIVQRSRDEARVLGRLQHRNIINVVDLISIAGKCAIIMEYLDGVDLKSLINYCSGNKIRIPRRVVFDVISSVASALDAAYNRPPLQGGEPLRLIHRDIKPSNIMLTIEADIKVLDFGTAQAKFEDREAKTQALAFGSAAYMSPERFLGEEDRISGDVYALGVTLYELLHQGRYGKSNVRPELFDAEKERRLDKLDLSELPEEVAVRILELLKKMLSWEEKDRPDLSEILHESEQLSSLINDGSLKIFSREVVQDCKASTGNSNQEKDDLEGQTFFEDMSQIFQDKNFSDENIDVSHPELDIVVPEQLASDQAEENVSPPSESLTQRSQPIPTSEQQKSVDTIKEAPVTSNTSSSTSSKSNLLMVVVLLLLVGVGAGGWIFKDSLFASPPPPVVVPEEAPVITGEAGTTKDFQGGEDVGKATLIVKPAGAVLVRISNSSLNYQYNWNGTDEMVLINAPAGRFKTRFENTERKLSGTFIEIVAGTECTFILDLDSGDDNWRREC